MMGVNHCGWSKRQAHLVAAIGAALVFCLAAEAIGADPAAVMRVEEDWEIQIGVPDPDNDAPQIINVIAPQAGIKGPHAVFELNHQTYPEYASGGMQFQYWNGDLKFGYRCNPDPNVLAHDNEVIRYTLSMRLSANTLTFEVLGGTSTTWAAFGGQGYLKLGVGTTLTSLDTYDPQTSLKYSRVGFSPNRVGVFALKEVRLYSADGQLVTTLTGDALGDAEPPPE